MYVFCDFEGYSDADLSKVGTWNWTAHESTRPLCFAFTCLDSNDIRLWKPETHELTTDAFALQDLAEDNETVFVAHHAFFEQAMWHNVMIKRYGFPEIPPDRWRCTRALSWAHGLPGNLEGACEALRLPIRKNKDGKRLIKLLCMPQPHQLKKPNPANGKYWTPEELPEEFEKLYAYCVDDVRALVGLFNRLRPLPAQEQKIWVTDQIINQRGIQLDIPLIQRALLFIEYQKYDNAEKFRELTGLPRASLRAQFQNWVNEQHFADNDPKIANTQAGTIKALISNELTLPYVKEAAELYQQAQKSSLIKYEKALQMSDANGIYREVANYAGAHTLRWTSWGAQWQNPPRPKHKIENVIHALCTSDYNDFNWLYGSITMPLSSMIRGLIIARPGKKLYVGDYVQIEARGLAWLAGDEPKIELYRGGMDVYSKGASEVFQCEVSKHVNGDKRQAYKVLELANQYGGGIGAGANFSKQYDFDPEPLYDIVWHTAHAETKAKAEWSLNRYKQTADPVDRLSDKAALAIDVFKQKWRAANPKIVDYWKALEDGVRKAIYTKSPVVIGAVTWFVDDIFLYCRLPSQRDIIYPYPDVSSDGTISYWGEDNGKLVKQYTYGGKLSENVTQALCRDFLAWALVDLENEGFAPVLHLHDEAVCEVDANDDRFERFKQVLGQPRKWAPGFPIDTDCWQGVRYDKR